MLYRGTNGTVYETLEPPIGKGGEGSVYRVAGKSGIVLKVLVPNRRTDERRRKLAAMIRSKMPQYALNQVAWPIDIVGENGRFAGFVMPEVRNSESLNLMYTRKYSCGLSERITLAMNLCSCIDAVHSIGQVCGDLNPENIGVDPHSGTVTLLDTDSYHITDAVSGTVFRCGVGRPEYLPAEVQKKMKNGLDLETTPLPTFTMYSDRFALAVHIFALLMNGCHPFACAADLSSVSSYGFVSVIAPQPTENILNGFFPFEKKSKGLTVPFYAPDYDYLPDRIRELFHRAFVSGHNSPSQRPDCVEWYAALSEMKKHLTYCHQKHSYPTGSKKCPWCELNIRMRTPVTFPAVSACNRNAGSGIPNILTQHQFAKPVAAAKRAFHRRLTDWQKVAIGLSFSALVFGLILLWFYNGLDKYKQHDQQYGVSSSSENIPKMIDFDYDEYVRDMGLDIYEPDDEKLIEIQPGERRMKSVEDADFSVTDIIFESDVGSQTFDFVPEYDGTYCINITELMNGTDVSVKVENEAGSMIASDRYFGNNDNLVIHDLTADSRLTITLSYSNARNGCKLHLGCQKPELDISEYTDIYDSVQFSKQENIYKFTPCIDGLYSLQISELANYANVHIKVYDRLGYIVAEDRYFSSRDSLAVHDMKAGEEYTVKILQDTGYSAYCLSVGKQKQITAVTANTSVTDCIEFDSQQNIYLLTAESTGEITISVSEIGDNVNFHFIVLNRFGENVHTDRYFGNGDSFTLCDTSPGEEYRIFICQKDGYSGYKLTIS